MYFLSFIHNQIRNLLEQVMFVGWMFSLSHLFMIFSHYFEFLSVTFLLTVLYSLVRSHL